MIDTNAQDDAARFRVLSTNPNKGTAVVVLGWDNALLSCAIGGHRFTPGQPTQVTTALLQQMMTDPHLLRVDQLQRKTRRHG